jgi:hypothetical protein
LRFEPIGQPKQFRQRTGPDQKKWSIKGARIIPYRLSELIEANGSERIVFVVEGEQDVETLHRHGVPATCAPMGANKWWQSFNEFFCNADVVISGDNDAPCRDHVALVAKNLHGVARRLRVLDLTKFWSDIEESNDITDWFAAGHTVEELWQHVEAAPDYMPGGNDNDDRSPPEVLEVIEPIDLWGQFDPPPLPSGLLPNIIEQFAHEEGDLTGADLSGLAVAALAVCAAALPDHRQLQVKKHDPNWLEAARLWVGLIGNPSTKKSPIMLRVTKPLKRLDTELWRKYLAAYEVYNELSKEERKHVPHPKQTRLRLEDTTIEAAQEVLKDSPDGVLCIQDELSGWFGAMDKYAGRGAAKDRGFWLQSFHGGPYALNRVSRGAAIIENLSVSLLGGIQPDPVRKIADDSVDDGLLQRLIPIVLRRGMVGKDAPTGRAGRRYDELIEQLQRKRPGVPVQFDDAALAIREKLEQKHLKLMNYEAVNRKLAAHLGKYDGLFARLCLLWQCIEQPIEDLIVTEHTARRVADFMHRFLLPHATAFYAGVLELSDDHERLTQVAGYILARKLTRVTNRDVQHGNNAMRGLKRQEIENVFDQLEALGWLTRTPSPYWSKPPHWLVNPEVHRRFAERAEREAAERAKQRAMLQEMFKGNKQ